MKITTKWLKRRIDIARTESYASGREAGIRLGIEEGKKQERESQAGRILEARTRFLDAIARSTDAAAHALMSFDHNL